MSRIYEALQKAESERKLDRREPELRVPDQPIPAGMGATAALAEPDDTLLSASLFPETPTVTAPYSTGLSGTEHLDLSRIPLRPWALSLAQLPALLERGPSVEQFRSLRSRIFELRDISPLKTILVSSGLPQEGKSFVSTNLALILARHKNSKVLLIDGDMRRYTLHQILGCESHPGLADYLAGKADLMEVMQRPEASQAAAAGNNPILPNLTFIAGGNGGDKAADLSGN